MEIINIYTYIALQRLPPSIGNLKRLRVLDLEENKLESLPQEIGKSRNICLTKHRRCTLTFAETSFL
jgi:hypothetical protein